MSTAFNGKRLSAIHESGHFVIADRLGLLVEYVTIRPDDTSNGHTSYLQIQAKAIVQASMLGNGDNDAILVIRSMLALAAGPVAAAKAKGGLVRSYPFPWSMHGGEGDHRVASSLLMDAERLGLPDLDDCVANATDLVEERWDMIERVAAGLMRRGELDWFQLNDILANRKEGAWA